MSRGFVSGFCQDLNDMIDLQVSLGYAESTYLDRTQAFDTFCAGRYPNADLITKPIVPNWLNTRDCGEAGAIHSMTTFARNFGRYQKAVGKNAFVISERFTLGKSLFVPCIFTDGGAVPRFFR